MDLKEQVDKLRQEIESSFDKQLKKLGLPETKNRRREKDKINGDRTEERERAESLIDIFREEEGNYKAARDKYIEEFSLTLFNRIAALKVMGLKGLIPEPITRRHEHGNRSFAHEIWLEDNPKFRSEPREGIQEFLREQFEKQADNIRLFSSDYPYDGLPEESDLLTIIRGFNDIEADKWKSDDIMGWLYEYYNHTRKEEFDESGEDVEWDKVSLKSQMYTPRWVVEFLLNNSLGKLWTEMITDSELAANHLIANVPEEAIRQRKSVEDIKLIDPACGSGNFLLYAYELFKEMYKEEGNVPEEDIPQAILENNLHGVDIDDRSVQIAQLSLYIKVMEDTGEGYTGEMNLVSTDFHLPDYKQAQDYFSELELNEDIEAVIRELWGDLEEARKFGSLIRIEEKLDKAQEKYIDDGQLDLFREQIDDWENWQGELIQSLQEAVSSYATSDGFQTNFLKSQSNRGLRFLEIILGECDVVSANPPYVDSSDYGSKLKDFLDQNFGQGSNFRANLYASFVKRNSELVKRQGKLAMIHPLTFMYLPSFEDVRELMINSTSIELFVDYGLDRRNLFGPRRISEAAFYILEKNGFSKKGAYFDISTNLQEKYKKNKTNECLKKLVQKKEHSRNYFLNQEKLKVIDDWPFIYWISDDFREKFVGDSLEDVLELKAGVQTGDNLRFLRFWWEVNQEDISQNFKKDSKRWIPYSKAGHWNKWYGNLWALLDWEEQGKKLESHLHKQGQDLYAKDYYFKEGITTSARTAKGITFRYLPPNHIFDIGAPSIFLGKEYENIFYVLGLLNSKLTFYTADSLNPTVNTKVGDLKRIPFTMPNNDQEEVVSDLSKKNFKIKKKLTTFDPAERLFQNSPLEFLEEKVSVKKSLNDYFKFRNEKISEILINEAVIDKIIFAVYDLTLKDRKRIFRRKGTPAGKYPISESTRKEFLSSKNLLKEVEDFVKEIPPLELEEQDLEEKKDNILYTYKSISKDEEAMRKLSEEFKVHPLTIAEWIKDSNVLPKKKVKNHAQKYILVLIREVLNHDQDGIVPLAEFAGESTLQDQVEEQLINEKGFTQRNINELEGFLGHGLESYLRNHFFKDESNLLNKFMYQPKTPFVWHLSSGENGGFEVAIIIYKWSRDRLISIKNKYLEKRRQAVKRQLNDLGEDESPESQKKRETYRAQLEEIDEFEEKVIDLLESGYDPVLDDGVGYNIAPLQKRDMLKYDPLTSSQLDKFLNADWGSRAEEGFNA